MTTVPDGSSSQEEHAMTLGERVLPMSPELIRKFENGFRGMENGDGPGTDNELVTALEQTLDGSKEIVLAEETKPDGHLDHVINLETPEPESPKEIIVVSESSTELPNLYEMPHAPRQSYPELFDVHVDIIESPNQEPDNISTDSEKQLSLVIPDNNHRRSSKWSAHVLFLASDVQLVVNLADYSPPEGCETKPTKVGQI